MIILIYQKLQTQLKGNMFVHFNSKIVNTDTINCITCDDFVEHNIVYVHYNSAYLQHPEDDMEKVKGAEAINLIMLLCPAVLEGMRAKHVKHSWAVHNLIGHPLMQIFTWLHLTKLALWIHDSTVPEPLSNNE
jgi:hypothetical protein